MKIITKCLVAAAVVLGLGFVGSATAGAHPPQVIGQPRILPYPYPLPFPKPGPILPRHDHDFLVLYKTSIFGPWKVYGKFETKHTALIVTQKLQRLGALTKVEILHNHGFGRIGW